MSAKSFSTTQKQQGEASAFANAQPITFDVDGEEFIAYPPTGSQLALALAANGSHSSTADRVAGVIDFLDGILDEKGQARFRERLLDREDPFDLTDVEQIVSWLASEWSGNPTQSQSGSPSSRRPAGRRLRATPPSTAAIS
jgi:hypothetical protein